MTKHKELEVICTGLTEGKNLMRTKEITKNEKFPNLFNFRMESSNGAEETFGVFNDANRSYGLIRKYLKATIFEEGNNTYNLGDTVGRDVIVVIESAVSKNGNSYWKITDFEKVTLDTDLDEFEICQEWKDATNTSIETVEDISDLEDMLCAE